LEHTRIVYNVYSFLESIGGTPEILKMLASMIVGTYCSFYAAVVNIAALYKVKTTDHKLFKPLTEDKSIFRL